jgi:cytochrome c-type biogenesis protein
VDNVSVWVALAGGLISLVSPCTLPLIPVYFASLAGPEALSSAPARLRFDIFLRSVSFVLGFALVFVLLGSGIGLVGFTVKSHIQLVRYISGALMILFGVFILAASRVSWLNFEKRLGSRPAARGYWRPALIGALFALAWTPCAGPVLGAILTLAFRSGSGWQGAYLLAFYSLGLALPFLLLGVGLDFLRPWLRRIGRFSGYIYLLGGVLLIAMGALILTNHIVWFSY